MFNSSGADLAGVWTSPSLLNNAGSAVASVNWLRLRLFSGGGSLRGCTVAASGIAFVGTGGATVETALVVDHTSGVVGAGYIDFAVVVGGPATVAAPGGSDITVAAGTLTCGDSNATNVAVAGNQAAGSPFAGVLKLGMPLSATLSWGSTIVSGALGFDGAFVDAVSARAFNGRAAPGTAITLTLADLALSPSMQTSWSTTDIAAYVDLPPAFAAAGITWTLDSAATYAANSNLIAWTASVDGWASLAHGVYDVVARPGAVGTVTSVRYAGARLRIVYGTAAQVANAGAAWAPATQRVALTASNTTARTFVTNATQLGVAQMYGAGGATPFTGLTSLASLYSAVYALADGAYGTDISLAVRGFDKVWDVAVNPVAATASDNFTVHAMLGEGTYVLKRASTAAFAAITDAQGVSDPYNADVVVIIDRTPPVAANVSYPPTGAPQAVGGVGNFLIPAGICTDAVSTQSAQIAVTKVAFVGGDGQGYSCATPAPLSAAYCQAPAVRGPPQELLLAVTCADEAGNTAVGYATVPIVTEGACALCCMLHSRSPANARAPFHLCTSPAPHVPRSRADAAHRRRARCAVQQRDAGAGAQDRRRRLADGGGNGADGAAYVP